MPLGTAAQSLGTATLPGNPQREFEQINLLLQNSQEVEESIDILPELNLDVSPQTTTSSETISDIHDTNAVQPSTSRRLRITDVLPLINFNEEDEDDHFDYIGQTLHRDAKNRMLAKTERVEKENAISARVNAITNEEIEAEVKKMWSVGGDSNKRDIYTNKQKRSRESQIENYKTDQAG
ncbi:hypothetical protein BpHYR1_003089 [Brachionus plicatilis]|uniref:Uncharacterized protein n=1 Tax=Brachionus plicatilis TaxID=10195 RepID=A0A3M7QBH3_BRAPC|nr:hypothetical protein BpHYR1_003089 [Brachionus plicatilis]